MEADRVMSGETTQKMHSEYSKVFTGIGCFKGTFSLQVKDNTKPCQVLPRYIAYTLEEPFKKRNEKTTEKTNTGTTWGRQNSSIL